jgi:hypothetical protein
VSSLGDLDPVRARSAKTTVDWSIRMLPEKLKSKVTAAVIAATLCTAGAAAAAGNLPGRAHSDATTAAPHVKAKISHPSPPGVVVDRGDDDEADDTTTTSATTSTTSTSTTSSTTSTTTSTSEPPTSSASSVEKATPVGPDVNGPAKKGLCNAYLGSLAKGHPKNTGAVAFRNLTNAATKAGQTVAEFCAPVVSTSSSVTTAPSGS